MGLRGTQRQDTGPQATHVWVGNDGHLQTVSLRLTVGGAERTGWAGPCSAT